MGWGSIYTLPVMRKRLDQSLVERGFAETRARARGIILRGRVCVNGKTAEKPGLLVADEADVRVEAGEAPYVSFGADKLIAAFEGLSGCFDPEGRTVLDIGASTGGFTDVLLRRGAAKVYAVDVGRGQLHPRLQDDARVVCLEGTDARDLTAGLFSDPIDAIVADVSFVSLTKVLAPALLLAAPGAWLIVLIKPQFEVGPEAVGKGGIVRDSQARESAIDRVRDWITAQAGWHVDGVVTWPGLRGRSNEEYLIGVHRHER